LAGNFILFSAKEPPVLSAIKRTGAGEREGERRGVKRNDDGNKLERCNQELPESPPSG
jgi:hypothetical protein